MSPERLSPPFSSTTVLDAQSSWQMLCCSLQHPFSIIVKNCSCWFSRTKYLEEGCGVYTADFCKQAILCTRAFLILGLLIDPIIAFKTFIYTQIISFYTCIHTTILLCIYFMNSWDEIISMLFALRFLLFWKRSSTHLPILPKLQYVSSSSIIPSEVQETCLYPFTYSFATQTQLSFSRSLTERSLSKTMLYPMHKPFLFSNNKYMAKQSSQMYLWWKTNW